MRGCRMKTWTRNFNDKYDDKDRNMDEDKNNIKEKNKDGNKNKEEDDDDKTDVGHIEMWVLA